MTKKNNTLVIVLLIALIIVLFGGFRFGATGFGSGIVSGYNGFMFLFSSIFMSAFLIILVILGLYWLIKKINKN